MGAHGGPDITEDGLVMHVDAANSKSYPGSGTTWYDLSPNGHNISLGSSVAQATYNATKVMHFPENGNGTGTNSTMNLSTSNFTVISWVRKRSNGNDGRTITALNNNWLLGHHDTTYGDYYAEGWVNDVSSPTVDTVWRMFTGTGHIANDVYTIYANTTQLASNGNGSQGPNGWYLNGFSAQYSDCEIANLICYNRVLTIAEITQIYNAHRTRFGL